MTADHCPACRTARELTEHRDATAAEWSIRRVTLNFASLVARQACPDFEPVAAAMVAGDDRGCEG